MRASAPGSALAPASARAPASTPAFTPAPASAPAAASGERSHAATAASDANTRREASLLITRPLTGRSPREARSRLDRDGGAVGIDLDLGEDLVGHVFGRELTLRVPELARGLVEAIGEDAEELPQHLDRDFVLLAEDLEEVGAPDGDELGVAHGVHARRARHAPDEGHLADVLAGPEVEQGLLAARDAHLALEHDEELVALVALADDEIAVLVLPDLDRLHHAKELALGVDRALFPDLHDEGGDVVFAAARVRELDERLDARVALEPERPRELVGRLQVAVKAVARENERVARDELDHEGVDLDPLVDAHRAGDGVLLLDLLDLFATQLPALDELIEDRVVFGDLLDMPVAREINAAVADVRDEALVPHDHDRGERGAHSALVGVVARLFVDLRAGALHRVLDEGDDVFRRDLAGAGGARLVVVEQLLLALDLVVHGAHGDRAGDLARGVTAHPVGDDEETELLVDEEVVLVVISHLADVCCGVEPYGVAQPHAR